MPSTQAGTWRSRVPAMSWMSWAGPSTTFFHDCKWSTARCCRFSDDAFHHYAPLAVLTGQMEVALRQERSAEEYRRALTAALAGSSSIKFVEALSVRPRSCRRRGRRCRTPSRSSSIDGSPTIYLNGIRRSARTKSFSTSMCVECLTLGSGFQHSGLLAQLKVD